MHFENRYARFQDLVDGSTGPGLPPLPAAGSLTEPDDEIF
jgi:hypothetical protein